jgi:hyaluronoglucosaminidase
MLALSFLGATASFDIVWNAQWPELCNNASAPIASDVITKWGVRANKGNSFNGDVVSTLYNHPGAYTIGDWPSLWPNGTAFANGGIPQKGNLSSHLAKVASDIDSLFPDPEFSGYVVIDWEVWEPWLKFWDDPAPTARWSAYANQSFALSNGDKAVAIAEWNATSLEFMARTLEVAKAARPAAKWGYYGMVGCDGQWDKAAGQCSDAIRQRNDALAPLWKAGNALFPSIYSSCRYGYNNNNNNSAHPDDTRAADDTQGNTPAAVLHCLPDAGFGNMTQAEKIPMELREVQRVNPAGYPVVPFTWPDLYTHQCAAVVGHCPLMRSPADLDSEFALAQRDGLAAGMIVWGSHGDVRPGTTDCGDFAEYMEGTLGPLLERVGAAAAPAASTAAATAAAAAATTTSTTTTTTTTTSTTSTTTLTVGSTLLSRTNPTYASYNVDASYNRGFFHTNFSNKVGRLGRSSTT